MRLKNTLCGLPVPNSARDWVHCSTNTQKDSKEMVNHMGRYNAKYDRQTSNSVIPLLQTILYTNDSGTGRPIFLCVVTQMIV